MRPHKECGALVLCFPSDDFVLRLKSACSKLLETSDEFLDWASTARAVKISAVFMMMEVPEPLGLLSIQCRPFP